MTTPVALDRYLLQGELGQGSFGVVYLAYDPKLEREVAVKLVRPEIAGDADVKLRFRREWKAIGRLRHPNIIELLDYADGEWMYLVTERLRGKTLLQLCRERLEPLHPVIVAAVIHEVALALEHAHEQHIVHRDVKPENIFLEPNGRVVLCDFGIAFAARSDEDTTMRGRNTQLLGSPLYMSPEQITADGVGPPTDLFSLGAVAYYLVTGKEAFREASVLGVLKRIQAGEHHPWPEPLKSTPFAAAVGKLLQTRVADRFTDAAAAADAFLDIVRNAGHGDPRRLLKQQLASLAEASTAQTQALKPLDALDGDSKTYVTKIGTQAHIVTQPVDKRDVVAIMAATGVSTAALRQRPVRSRATLATAAVVVLVAGAAGVYAIRNLPKVPAPVAVELTPPLELPPPATVERPNALPPEPPVAHDPPPAKRPPAVVAAPMRAKGKLRIVVIPWGDVFVDGVKVGVTPEVRELELTAGTHQVRIVNPNFAAQEKTVSVPANDTVKLRVEL